MAENTPEATGERLDRLETQMEAVLGHLRRLTADLPPVSDYAAGSRPAEPQPPPVLQMAQTVAPPPPDLPLQTPAPEVPFSVIAREAERTEFEEERLSASSAEPAPSPAPQMEPPIKSSAGMTFDPPVAAKSQVDWEDVVGRQWALWIGAIAVFLAVAFFLIYAWDKLSPFGRLGVGACAGLGLMIAGEIARGKTQKSGFSEGMAGGGLAILYLDAWAAFSRYSLGSYEVSLALMVAITVLGVVLAIRYDSKSLHALATIGGFATPALLGGGASGGNVLPFLTYVTVLNAGVLAVAVSKGWRGNVVFSALATLLLLGGWSDSANLPDHRWVVMTFFTANFLLYAASAISPVLAKRESTESTDWLLLIGATAFYFAAGNPLIGPALGSVPGAFAVAVGLLFAGLAILTRFRCPLDEPLKTACIGIACSMAALAVPIQFKQGMVSVGWSVEAAVLLSLAAISHSEVVRRAGQVVWGLAAVSLLAILSTEAATTGRLLLNEHGIPVLFFALASVWAAWYTRRSNEDEARPVYAMAWVAAGAWLVAEQIQYGFAVHTFALPKVWGGAEPYLIAIAISIYATAVHAFCARFGDFEARITAIATSFVAIALILGATGIESHQWAPVFNPRFLAYVVSILSLLSVAWVSGSRSEGLTAAEGAVPRVVTPALHALIVLYVGLEIAGAYALNPMHGWQTAAGMTIAALMCSYGAMLLLPAFLPARAEIRYLAYALVGIGALVLMTNAVQTWDGSVTPLANARFVDFVISGLALFAAAALSRDVSIEGERDVPATFLVAAGLISLWALTQETYFTFAFFHEIVGPYWERWAQSAVSVVWTLAAFALLLLGIARESRVVRIAALGLFGVTCAKVFLFDLGFLESQFRVLSFGGLGAALIGISWLYSRFGGGSEGAGLEGGSLFAHKH